MTSYEVLEVVSSEQKPKRNGGTFTKYLLELKEAGRVGFADFSGKTQPQVGQSLEGNLVDEGFGMELKQPRSNNGPPRGGKSPQEQKTITRQGAQQRAALYLIAKSMVKQHLDQDLTRDDFKKLVDWFVEDAS